MGDTITGSEASLETSAELEDDDFQLVGEAIAVLKEFRRWFEGD